MALCNILYHPSRIIASIPAHDAGCTRIMPDNVIDTKQGGGLMADDSIAIVTGGSRGIGRAIGVALGGLGYTVVVNYRGNQRAGVSLPGIICCIIPAGFHC